MPGRSRATELRSCASQRISACGLKWVRRAAHGGAASQQAGVRWTLKYMATMAACIRPPRSNGSSEPEGAHEQCSEIQQCALLSFGFRVAYADAASSRPGDTLQVDVDDQAHRLSNQLAGLQGFQIRDRLLTVWFTVLQPRHRLHNSI